MEAVLVSGRGKGLMTDMADLADTIPQHALLYDLSPRADGSTWGEVLGMKKAHEGRTLGS